MLTSDVYELLMTIVAFAATSVGLIAGAITIIQFVLKNRNNLSNEYHFEPIANEKRVVIDFDKANINKKGTFEYSINQFRLERLKCKVFGADSEDGWLFIYNPYGSMLVGKMYITDLVGGIVFGCMAVFMAIYFSMNELKDITDIFVKLGSVAGVSLLTAWLAYNGYHKYKIFMLTKTYYEFLKSKRIRIGREFTMVVQENS